MARVNHKKVKQMLEETRKKITDRQFFTSRILAGHYEDMAAAQTQPPYQNEDYLEAERAVYRGNKQSEHLDQCRASDCNQAKSPSSGSIYDCDRVVYARTGTRSVYGFFGKSDLYELPCCL